MPLGGSTGCIEAHGVNRGVGGVEPWHRGLQGPPTTVGGDQRPDNLTTGAENMSRSADRAAILAGPSQPDLRISFHRVYRFSSPGCIIPSYGDPSLFVVFSRWPLYFRIVRYQWMVRCTRRPERKMQAPGPGPNDLMRAAPEMKMRPSPLLQSFARENVADA